MTCKLYNRFDISVIVILHSSLDSSKRFVDITWLLEELALCSSWFAMRARFMNSSSSDSSPSAAQSFTSITKVFSFCQSILKYFLLYSTPSLYFDCFSTFGFLHSSEKWTANPQLKHLNLDLSTKFLLYWLSLLNWDPGLCMTWVFLNLNLENFLDKKAKCSLFV